MNSIGIITPKQTLIMVGAFPPPVGGQSNINEALFRRLSASLGARKLNLSAERLDRGLKYHARRFIRAVTAFFSVLVRPGGLLYISTDSGYGLAYNWLVVLAARTRRMHVALHHHSFSFISRHSWLMRVLKITAGREAIHVFLCECMGEDYIKQYGAIRNPAISSNACHLPSQPGHARSIRGKTSLTIGLISHLSPEKGLDDFIDLVRKCEEAKLPVKAILAGPPVTPVDQAKIARAVAAFPQRLEFRGPIYGEAKAKFFSDIDVFMFPTRFRIEAQPVVLLEAISQGCPLISFGRGCIANDMSGSRNLVLESSADFCAEAQSQLEKWIACPSDYEAASLSNLALYDAQVCASNAKLDQLIALLRQQL